MKAYCTHMKTTLLRNDGGKEIQEDCPTFVCCSLLTGAFLRPLLCVDVQPNILACSHTANVTDSSSILAHIRQPLFVWC